MQKKRLVLNFILVVSIAGFSLEAMSQTYYRRSTGIQSSRQSSRFISPRQFTFPTPIVPFYSSSSSGISTGIHSQRLATRGRQPASRDRPASIYDLQRSRSQYTSRSSTTTASRSTRPGTTRPRIYSRTPSAAPNTKVRPVDQQATRKKRAVNNYRFQQVFWHYLTQGKNPYKNWAAYENEDGLKVKDPHGASSRTYANYVAAGNSTVLPPGSILVKEHLAEDEKTLQAISVMYRAKGYNPQGNDWYWIQYKPDGSVAREDIDGKTNQLLAGQTASCIKCHRNGGAKLVFSSFRRDLALNGSKSELPRK